MLGYISIYASTIYAATLILGATCSIGSDGAYVATKYQNYGMFVATTLLTFGMTCVSSELLNKLNMTYIVVQFAMLLALIISLAAGTPSELKNTASFVFTEFENTGFWTNNGWAFVMSFLTPVWVVSGFESSATIAEEASNAAKAVPFAMISSLVTAAVTGWAVSNPFSHAIHGFSKLNPRDMFQQLCSLLEPPRTCLGSSSSKCTVGILY